MIYRIYHFYTKPEYRQGCDRYIETRMAADELEDIYTGLQLYIEDYTTYGDGYYITEDMFAKFLCEFYDCMELAENEVNIDDAGECDIYFARESRLSPTQDKYIERILNYIDSDFFGCIKAYFNDDMEWIKPKIEILTTNEILSKYGRSK